MKSNYLIWGVAPVENAAVLYNLENVEDDFELTRGVSRAKDFPTDGLFKFHPDYPNNTILVDSLPNTDLLVVGSAELKSVIQEHAVPNVEFLPVKILNHKNKPVRRDYFIVHAVGLVDAIDQKESVLEWGLIDPESIDSVERLVLDEKRIPRDRQLFRLKYFHDLVLIRSDLATAITKARLSGIRWIEVSGFPES
jgi:hypothetical protein